MDDIEQERAKDKVENKFSPLNASATKISVPLLKMSESVVELSKQDLENHQTKKVNSNSYIKSSKAKMLLKHAY